MKKLEKESKAMNMDLMKKIENVVLFIKNLLFCFLRNKCFIRLNYLTY